jgi:hypothetical protein
MDATVTYYPFTPGVLGDREDEIAFSVKRWSS